MKCGRCDKEGAKFMGSEHSYPHPDDCSNTPDNLPFGQAWLCDDCEEDAYEAHMQDEAEKYFSERDFNSHTRRPIEGPAAILLEAVKLIGWGTRSSRIKYIEEKGRPFDYKPNTQYGSEEGEENDLFIARIATMRYQHAVADLAAPIGAAPFRDFVDANFEPAPAKINRRQVHSVPDIAPAGPDRVEQEFINECAEDSRADMV